MRLLLKILFEPVILILTVFIWLCMGLLYCSAFLFGLAVLVTYSVQNGIILLVIAFLISPMGLPMAAACLLGKMQDFRYWIQDGIYG